MILWFKNIQFRDLVLLVISVTATILVVVLVFLWQNSEDKAREYRNAYNHLLLHETDYKIGADGVLVKSNQ